METLYNTKDYEIVVYTDDTVNSRIQDHITSGTRKLLLVIGDYNLINNSAWDLLGNTDWVSSWYAPAYDTAVYLAQHLNHQLSNPVTVQLLHAIASNTADKLQSNNQPTNNMNVNYKTAKQMYEQYQEDVAWVGRGLNLAQINTLQLLETNVRSFGTRHKPLTFWERLIGAFKNRKN